MQGIGIGYAQFGEDLALEPFHMLGLFVGLMIVSQKMQKTMDRKMGEVILGPLALSDSLSGNRLVCDGNVAERNRLQPERSHSRCWK